MSYHFEDYVLDPDRRELRRDRRLLAIEPKVFDLLLHLVGNRERVVSKDDLIATIWGGRIVSESALTTCINAARTAIGDSGEVQRLIKTLPRKGIRFVGKVEQRPTSASAAGSLPDTPNLALPDKPSVAVLPFTNMSGDPEQDYFADGIAEDIITALSRFKALFVIARYSSFTYKERAVDVKQVSGASWGCATCWKAAFARRQTGCASPDSSSIPPLGHIFGQNGLMAASATSSICRTR
jgi:adenylate cyclase